MVMDQNDVLCKVLFLLEVVIERIEKENITDTSRLKDAAIELRSWLMDGI